MPSAVPGGFRTLLFVISWDLLQANLRENPYPSLAEFISKRGFVIASGSERQPLHFLEHDTFWHSVLSPVQPLFNSVNIYGRLFGDQS